MFRELRRKKQALSREDTEKILKDGVTGILAVSGDEGYPYTVPINYVYDEGILYLHCARNGHKTDAIQSNDKVSFCVIGHDELVPEKFTTYFTSVVAFGRASVVTDEEEKRDAMRALNRKYAPGLEEAGERLVQKSWNALSVIRIDIEHLSGKEANELRKRRD